MKRIYLILLMAFCGGTLFAQSTTQPSQNNAVTSGGQDRVSANPGSTLSGVSKANSLVVENAKSVEELPGYPVLGNTGNVDKDKENFDAAKEKWMKENKALYDEFLLKEKRNENNKTEHSKK